MPNIKLAHFLLLSSLMGSYAFASIDQSVSHVLPYKEGRLLVKTIDSYPSDSLATTADAIGARMVRSYSLVPGLWLYEFDENIDMADAMEIFQSSHLVQYVEPDYYYAAAAQNDPRFAEQWSLENNNQTGGLVDADINATSMWSMNDGDKNIVIAVIDTGVDYTHQDLAQNMWQNVLEIPGNGIDDDQNGYIDDIYGCNTIANDGNPLDDNAHGTHVAGTIGAKGNNAVGVVGMAPNVSIAACKFLSASGSGLTSDAIQCLQYFASLKTRSIKPVNIIATNNSWGGSSPSTGLMEAIKAHEDLGILFVAAAGNSGRNSDESSYYPANFELSNIITVAATDHNDRLASFSNYGRRSVHLGAPGVKILSTVLNQGYNLFSGTSMAAPHVTGLLAIAKSHYPDYDYKQLKNLVIASGTPIPSLQNKTISGRRIRGADINGTGALTCANQITNTRVKPLDNLISLSLGSSILLSSLKINCSLPLGPMVLYSDGEETITLQDQGLSGDTIANDGVYSLLWQPKTAKNYALDFGGGDIVSVSVSVVPLSNNAPNQPMRSNIDGEAKLYELSSKRCGS